MKINVLKKLFEKRYSALSKGGIEARLLISSLGSAPHIKKTVTELSSESMEKFSAENPDDPAVRYFSYAGKMKNSFSDLIFFFTFPIIKCTDGDNDGLVPVESAKWGIFKGVIIY